MSDEKKCACGMPLTSETTCSCDPTKCCKCCECDTDCSCGCKKCECNKCDCKNDDCKKEEDTE